MLRIRAFDPHDGETLVHLFRDTVHHVNRRDYSEAQVHAWAPEDVQVSAWIQRCLDCFTYVALVQDPAGSGVSPAELIVGFAQVTIAGYVDCFYCHKDWQRQGVGRQLYQTIEAKAQTLAIPRLVVEASITAQPFFRGMGFQVITLQWVSRRGQWLQNYWMEKHLILAMEPQDPSP